MSFTCLGMSLASLPLFLVPYAHESWNVFWLEEKLQKSLPFLHSILLFETLFTLLGLYPILGFRGCFRGLEGWYAVLGDEKGNVCELKKLIERERERVEGEMLYFFVWLLSSPSPSLWYLSSSLAYQPLVWLYVSGLGVCDENAERRVLFIVALGLCF